MIIGTSMISVTFVYIAVVTLFEITSILRLDRIAVIFGCAGCLSVIVSLLTAIV